MELGAILASLLFSFGQAFSNNAKALALPVPQQFIEMIPYILTILVLIGFVGKARPPKEDGKPYEK